MGWNLFKKKKSIAVTTDSPEGGSIVEPPAGAPTLGSFSFQNAAPEPTLDEPVEPPIEGLAQALREKVAERRGGAGARVLGRVAEPVLVPSLRERALVYRLAAEIRGEAGSETALSLWRAYLGLCPEDADAHFATARHLLGIGRAAAAEDAFAEAWRLDPLNGLAAGGLGHCAGARGEHERALGHFEDATNVRPDCLDMLGALAHAQHALGQDENAAATEQRIHQLQTAG